MRDQNQKANSDHHVELPNTQPQAPASISVETADKASKDYSVPLPYNFGSTPNGPISGRRGEGRGHLAGEP